MIVRKFVVLLCSLAGHLTATNGLYLNFAVPKSRALETLQNDAGDQRNVDKLFRKGRHHHKKLVILDRKDKRVDDFVKKLMRVIEMNEGDKLLNDGTYDKRKMNCRHMSFGSIFNAKAKRKRCKKLHSEYKRKQSWINFVIPIPIKNKNIFTDSTRQGFSDDYLIDFNRRADIDFDYYNTVHRTENDSKETSKAKETKTQIEFSAKKVGKSDAAPKSLRRDHTRFKIVPNKYDSGEYNDKRAKQKKPFYSDNSDSDKTDNTEDDNENKAKKNSDSDSDLEKYIMSKTPMKKIKDEWNDIIKMSDSDPGSSEESSPPKKPERNKNKQNTYETNSSENEGSDSDASPQEDFDHKDKNKEKYVYMQGHRLYNSNVDKEESRRMRNKNYFLPKRSYWNENSIKHLGPYWNSHEIAGVHID